MLVALALPAAAAEVGGVKLEERTRIGNAELVLNGAGVRTRVIFDVYVIGLYVRERSSSAATLLQQPGPKRIAITMLRDVDATQFVDALRDGLKQNLADAELKAFEPQVAQLAAIMSSVKTARQGMRIALDLAEGGTRVVLDGNALGVLAGDDFYRALLRIWLGERPVQDDLKKALLGAG